MYTLKRTNSDNIDVLNLVSELDKYLKTVDGEDHLFYDQYNSIKELNYIIVAYLNDEPIGCGAIKKFDQVSMEVKRMYVTPIGRGKGVGFKILNALELWAKELHYDQCILETGKKQIEAIGLYKKNGYQIIPNYGVYENIKNSLCFVKNIK